MTGREYYRDLPLAEHLPTQELTLRDLYYDPGQPGAYSSTDKLFHAARQKGLKVTRPQVQKFLDDQATYTRHRPLYRRIKRQRTVVSGPNVQWQADLVVMPRRMTAANDGYNHILTVIDIFSKKAYARSLKSKSAPELTAAMQDILESISPEDRPKKIQSDKGTEFLNKRFQTMIKGYGIKHFSTEQDDIKASIVERFNRTLRSAMHRYIFAQEEEGGGKEVWHDALQRLVESYNQTLHSATGVTPEEVDDSNAHLIRDRLYEGGKGARYLPQYIQSYQVNRKKPIKPKYKVGDLVRIAKERTIVTRGFNPNFTAEIFTIYKVISHVYPYRYILKDQGDKPAGAEVVKGFFYEPHLQKVTSMPKTIKVHILEQDLASQQVLVHWLGWPKEYDRWISMKDLEGDAAVTREDEESGETSTATANGDASTTPLT